MRHENDTGGWATRRVVVERAHKLLAALPLILLAFHLRYRARGLLAVGAIQDQRVVRLYTLSS